MLHLLDIRCMEVVVVWDVLVVGFYFFQKHFDFLNLFCSEIENRTTWYTECKKGHEWNFIFKKTCPSLHSVVKLPGSFSSLNFKLDNTMLVSGVSDLGLINCKYLSSKGHEFPISKASTFSSKSGCN